MKLIVLGSSSSANGYILLSDSGEKLILEAGMKVIEYKKALNFNIDGIRACVVTHAHRDHSASVPDFFRMGVPILAPLHVFESFDMNPGIVAETLKKYNFGGFSIIPFHAFHDVPCVGYFIHHAEMGNLVFLTDSFMSEHIFKGVNHFLVECNYSDEALQAAIDAGQTPPLMRNRLMLTHMELKTLERFLLSHDLSGVYNIILIHLSKFNSDKKQLTDTLASATGRYILIAEAGLEVTLNKNPY